MSLTTCLKKSASLLEPEVRRDIMSRAAEFRRQGKSATEAGLAAVDALLKETRDHLIGIDPDGAAQYSEGGDGNASKITDAGGTRADRGIAGQDAQAEGLTEAEAAAVRALPQALIDRLLGNKPSLAQLRKIAARAEGLDVQVVQSMADLPPEQRKKLTAIAPDGQVRGVYFPDIDRVWLIADHLHSEAEANFVLLHEAFHRGLAQTFGPDARRVLRQMYHTNGRLQQLAKEQMDTHGIELDEAIEEALADLAGRGEARNLRGWDRLVKLIRAWLEHIGQALGFGIKWTDAMVEDFVAGVRREGLRGGPHANVAAAPSASRTGALQWVHDQRLPLGYQVGDLLNSSGKLSWWHKTVGTMHNLAERSPAFKKVYDGAQRFLNDVSLYASEAADLAPSLLPKLETLKDITKAPLSAEDTKAIAGPIFEGTLRFTRDERGEVVATDGVGKAGVLWTDDELRERFKLNAKQIGLYREFRAAVDHSLTDLAVSDMIRYGGSDVEAVRAAALAAPNVRAAAKVLTDHLAELADGPNAARAALLADTGAKIQEKAERAADLMARGYAPLSRFGHYTLDVVDQTGERVYFGLFETEREANRMARQMRKQFPQAKVAQGTTSDEKYKMFAGVSPETLELFGEMLGLEAQGNDAASKAFQEYLKLTKSNRSAMKRLIERKGIEGFNEDAGRVLAGFVYSNARQTAKNLHLGELTRSVQDIAENSGQGELLDAAVKLHQYVTQPQEEGQAIKGLMFTQFLGGSIAAGLVNMTQPFMVTFPYLSQWGGVASAAARMKNAVRDAIKAKTGDGALDAALKRAEEEGIVSPQEVHSLIAQARGAGALKAGDGTMMGDAAAKAGNALSKLMLAWGRPFALAEQFNRRVTFIAAYRTAVAEKMDDPSGFAAHAIAETQFTYNRGCVDDLTECLTAAGWKRHADLRPGEMVYALDANGALVESRLVDVHRFSGPINATEYRNQNGLSMVLTPEHKCVIQNYSSRDQRWQGVRLVRADAVKGSHHFLRAPLGDATGRVERYTDDEVRLFAWVAAEGSLHRHRNTIAKRQVMLHQSAGHNPGYVAEIDALLDRLGGHYSRGLRSRSDSMVWWNLRKPLWVKIHEALPSKMVTHDLVRKLTPAQMVIFLETFVKGDGHIPEEGGSTITQKDIGNLGALQAMAVLSGQSSTLYERMGRHDFGMLYLSKTSLRAHRRPMTETPVTLDMVWCPQTEHGTWIARRNGRTFVTGNSRPNWARGAVGGALFTFKQYSISYVELLARMASAGPEGKKAALLGVAMMFLASGLQGLPGADDLDDVIDALLQRLGYAFSTKQAKREFLAGVVGEGGAQFLMKGISGLPGAPIDVAGRLGLGNLVPGTGLLVKKSDHGQDVAELAGPVGAVGKQVLTGLGALADGNLRDAATSVLPVAAANLVKAYDMASTGMYRDGKGRKVVDTDAYDALAKAIGFQPSDVARVQNAASEVQRTVDFVKMHETEIADRWARAMFERDSDGIAAARQEVADWNATNPEAKISITSAQLIKRVKEMNASRADRVAKTAPKEIRASVRREMEATQ